MFVHAVLHFQQRVTLPTRLMYVTNLTIDVNEEIKSLLLYKISYFELIAKVNLSTTPPPPPPSPPLSLSLSPLGNY